MPSFSFGSNISRIKQIKLTFNSFVKMAAEKILIAVKTYPSLSKKYDELVCTAGVRQDGSWIRLYPIPFRKMDYDKQYRKYEWIEADIVRNEKDFRPETFRVINLHFFSITSIF